MQASVFSVAPYYGGNVDVDYPNHGTQTTAGKDFDVMEHYVGSNGINDNFYPYVLKGDGTWTVLTGGGMGAGAAKGGGLCAGLGGKHYGVYHNNDSLIHLHESMITDACWKTLAYVNTTSGGCTIVRYKTDGTNLMLTVCKDGNSVLYVSITGARSFGDLITVATLGSGFSDWCARSEAMNLGDPEIVHLVYIKSTGELCYCTFKSDALTAEVVLEASGATYPVIVLGSAGRIYVFYVMSGKIYLKKYNGSSWLASTVLYSSHVYNSPAYLSGNGNAQSGKICLIWTEGTASPYELWFCYLED